MKSAVTTDPLFSGPVNNIAVLKGVNGYTAEIRQTISDAFAVIYTDPKGKTTPAGSLFISHGEAIRAASEWLEVNLTDALYGDDTTTTRARPQADEQGAR